jgi:hypothetical protein
MRALDMPWIVFVVCAAGASCDDKTPWSLADQSPECIGNSRPAAGDCADRQDFCSDKSCFAKHGKTPSGGSAGGAP